MFVSRGSVAVDLCGRLPGPCVAARLLRPQMPQLAIAAGGHRKFQAFVDKLWFTGARV